MIFFCLMRQKLFKKPYIHPHATVIGNVTFGDGCSIWPGAVLRGDMAPIKLGDAVNIQDNATLHCDSRHDILIGNYNVIAHNVMLHGCRIGNGCLIGIGSIILDKAEIGDGAMITAGCLIRGGMKIPAQSMVIQKDGKLRIVENKGKPVYAVASCLEYMELAKRARKNIFMPFTQEEELAMFEVARKITEEMRIS